MAVARGESHELALQKYMLLQDQHETLRVHLDQIRPISCDGYASTFTSPSTSPTRSFQSSPSVSPVSSRRHSRSSDRTSGNHHRRARARCSGWEDAHRGIETTLDTIPDEETLSEISLEEQRLFDVNEGIKRALMELLNCDASRSDPSFRMWVQTRLMETEKELRSGRRRRSS